MIASSIKYSPLLSISLLDTALNSVKHRIHSFGTRLLDVVDEEEVFLRQIPQIPHLLHPGEESTLRIPLWHYSSATAEHTAALKHLSELASDRIAIHRRRTSK